MKKTLLVLSTLLVGTAAQAQTNPLKASITVWSWDVAAKALQATVPSFNKKYPNVQVKVVDLGNQNVYDRGLAGCAAGGVDLPDVYSIENNEAEVFWARFPDCFTDLNTLGAGKVASQFPAFKWTELTANNRRYAMPWDSGPVMVFYRRDLYKQAGIDPTKIQTWDDFIAAGKTMNTKLGGKVKMVTTGTGQDDDWFRMLSNQNGCFYFNTQGTQVTVNQPGCVTALTNIKKLYDANVAATSDWNGSITNFKTSKVASFLAGGWYEGTIRTNAPDQSGKWGIYQMPASAKGGARAANLGGSALAIPSTSKNKEAAWAFMQNALGTTQGQVTMLKSQGLVPSLLSAEKDAYVSQPQAYWGGQKIWKDVLGTLGKVPQARGTQYFQDARQVMIVVQGDFVKGKYPSAKAALDDAAKKISAATGLPTAK